MSERSKGFLGRFFVYRCRRRHRDLSKFKHRACKACLCSDTSASSEEYRALNPQKLRQGFLNAGHFVDHLMMLIFAKAAFNAGLSFGLAKDGAYAEMIPYGVPALILFGACAPLAAYIADKWDRNAMITVFFVGVGIAAIITSFAQTPLQMAFGMGLLGIFAAIYHPIGITMVIQGGGNVGWRLGINGVWGNMGIAVAPLITGFLLADYDWRMAFIVPGIFSILVGFSYAHFAKQGRIKPPIATAQEKEMVGFTPGWKRALCALTLVSAGGGFVFGTMTFIIPRMFEVSLAEMSTDVAVTGALAALVYAIASFTQLITGRIIDRSDVRPVLMTVALGQPIFIGIMAMETNYALFAASFLALSFVFGQVPITDAVLSRYIPDEWRAKTLSIKFLLNLIIGAMALLCARYILGIGGGFGTVMAVTAVSAVMIIAGALLLPKLKENQLVA
jgi:MFS family permease